MQIVRDLGGYSVGRADLVRRAMAKKKHDVMTQERQTFLYGQTDEEGNVLIDGAVRRGVSEEVANAIFDEMMDFASYAFNKSHAAAYALVAYQTAYLKYFYSAQYMAALLSSVLDSPEKVARYTIECNRMGIRILPPDINRSCSGFTVSGKDVRFGLAVIKNIGVACIDSIVSEREKYGEFKSYEDFVKRTVGLAVSKRVHENLIRSGAFDALGEKRSQLLAAYESMVDAAAEDRKRNLEGQLSLFGEEETETVSGAKYPPLEEFPMKRLLAMEKECIGFYISGHPLDEYKEDLARLSTVRVLDILQTVSEDEGEQTIHEAVYDGAEVSLCGILSEVKSKLTRNGQMMAFAKLEDLTGKMECIVFPKTYLQCKPYLTEDAVVKMDGRLSFREDEEPKLLCNSVVPITQAQEEARKLYLRFPLGKDYLFEHIKPILTQHRGNAPVQLYPEETKRSVIAPMEYWVEISEELTEKIAEIIGKENVAVK